MEVPIEILNRYMERRKQDLELCLACLKQQDFTLLEKVGHQLKGNGITFGYSELSDIGLKMELAARQMNIPEIERTLESFSSWVGQHIS